MKTNTNFWDTVWFVHVYYGGDTQLIFFPHRLVSRYDDLLTVPRAHVMGGPHGGGLL